MTDHKVDVVIVAWNSASTIGHCVKSAITNLAHTRAGGAATVVDNCSSDGTAEIVSDSYPSVEVVSNSANVGFASACNQGARQGAGEFLLFLNPDCVLLPHALDAMVEFMLDPENERVGACGPRVLDAAGAPATAAARFPSVRIMAGSVTRLARVLPILFPPHAYTAQELAGPRRVDQIIGACFFVRRDLFEKLGGFDERFFLYYEEVDLAYRLAASGWSSWYVPSAECTHFGSRSTVQVRAHRLFWNLRGRLIFSRKHFGPYGFVATVTLSAAEVAVRLAASAFQGRARFLEVSGGVTMLARWTTRWLRDGATLENDHLR